MKFLTSLLNMINEASADITTLPNQLISEIKKLIRKGAQDLEQEWANALELVHTAYKVANVRRPAPDQKGAWKQYEELIQYGVKELHKTRGLDGKWRTTDTVIREHAEQMLKEVKSGKIKNHPWIGKRAKNTRTGDEGEVIGVEREHTFSQLVPFVTLVRLKLDNGKSSYENRKQHMRLVKGAKTPMTEQAEKNLLDMNIGRRRFFIDIPNSGSAEVAAKTMDDIIEQITNKLRRHGAKTRIEERAQKHAILSVWVNDVKRERITVKEVS